MMSEEQLGTEPWIIPLVNPPDHGERLAELRPGRLFVHRTFADLHTGGTLYRRLEDWLEAERQVVYTTIDRRPDRISQPSLPWRMPVHYFLKRCLGEWYEGAEPPPPAVGRRAGLAPLSPPKKAGPSGPGQH
jgi:hypothetical protein